MLISIFFMDKDMKLIQCVSPLYSLLSILTNQ